MHDSIKCIKEVTYIQSENEYGILILDFLCLVTSNSNYLDTINLEKKIENKKGFVMKTKTFARQEISVVLLLVADVTVFYQIIYAKLCTSKIKTLEVTNNKLCYLEFNK